MEALIESIVSKLHHLSQPRLHEVLDFVEFLIWQEKHKNQASISSSEAEVNNQDFEALADQLANELIRSIGVSVPQLSDYGVSRAGIYEEHP